jgi:hypothetical protein
LLILTAVAVALGGYIFFVERHQSSTDQARSDRARLFPALSRAAITQIQLQRPGAPAAVFTRDGSGWKLSPGDAPADTAALEELLTEIDLGEVDRAADVSAQAAGLDKPVVSIELGAGLQRFRLRAGHTDPGGRGVYALRDDNPAVVVAPRRVMDLAVRDTGAFRDRRVIPAPLVAEAISIKWTDGARTSSVRHGEGRWQNQRQEWVARQRVVEVLRRLADLKADRFIPAPASAMAPDHSLDVALGAGQTFSLRARGPGCAESDQLALQRTTAGGPGSSTGEWLCVPKAPWQALWALLAAVAQRDLRMVAAPGNEITQIEIADSARRLVLRREVAFAAWTIVAPPVPYAADGDAIEQWLSDLGSLTLTPDSTTAGAARGPSRRLVVRTQIAQVPETVEIDVGRGPRVAVRRPGESAAAPLLAPARLLLLTDPDPLRFRSRAVLSFARYDTQRVQITGARPEEAVKDARESWQLTKPTTRTLDQDALDRKLAAITNLRAIQFIAPGTGPAFHSTQAIEVTESGGRTHRVEIAATGDSGCRARINDGAQTVFVLAPDVCADLTRPLAR